MHAIIFVASLSGFNERTAEGENDLRAASAVFGEIAAKECFATTPMFLFLNKEDLFRK